MVYRIYVEKKQGLTAENIRFFRITDTYNGQLYIIGTDLYLASKVGFQRVVEHGHSTVGILCPL